MRLADFILANIEPILAEWEVFARSIWPGVATTDPATLRDDAEDVLRATAADMVSAQTASEQADKSWGHGLYSPHSAHMDRASVAHGRGRHGSGFDLAALIAEYRALRASVIRLWRESRSSPDAHDLADLTRFNESIDQSLTQAVVAFTRIVEVERQAAMDEQSQLADQLRDTNAALLVSSVQQHELIAQAQEDRDAIAAVERELSDFFETASIGLHWVGPDGTILRVNQAELDMLGYGFPGGREEYVGRHIAEFHADQPVIEDILARLLRGETLRDCPARMRCKDGSIRDVLINSSAYFENGEFIHTRCFTQDITERKLALEALRDSEERYRRIARDQQLLAAELSHRVKNVLATVRAIASQTRRHAATPEEFDTKFEDRISMLARAHGLLTATCWEGASIADIVQAVVRPHVLDFDSVVSMEGPEVLLPPSHVLALSMLIHELTTNAVKHGSLSTSEGRLVINWREQDGRSVLAWREAGGPPVAPPTRRGFGTSLVERIVSFELDGTVVIDYPREGLTCAIEFPIAAAAMIGS